MPWHVIAWIMVTVVVWASLTDSPPSLPNVVAWDKAQHFVAYAAMSFWFGSVFTRSIKWPFFLVVLGVTLEYLQGIGGIREMDAMDMLANTIGVSLGWALTYTVLGYLPIWLECRLCGLKGE